MAYRLPCVVDDCDFTAEGETEDEVVNTAEQHAEDEHPEGATDERELRDEIERG